MKYRTGTVKAPLYSERVAVMSELEESEANELKRYLEVAHDETRLPRSRLLIRACLMAGAAALIGMTLTAFVAEARTPGLVIAPLGIGAFAWLGRMTLAAQEKEAATLIQKLAQAVVKPPRLASRPEK